MNKAFYNNLFNQKIQQNIEESGNNETNLNYVQDHVLDINARIVDIGTNIGTLPHLLKSAGYTDVTGIDISEQSIEYGLKKYPELAHRLLSYDGNRIPFDNNTFDVVTLFDVIEHIPDVPHFLKTEVARILKPGGLCIFQTPNKPLNILWTIVSKRTIRTIREFLKTEHCSLQTQSSLRRNFDNAGFDSLQLETYSILSTYNIQKVRRALGPLGGIILRILAHSPRCMQPNIFGIAKKPSANGYITW